MNHCLIFGMITWHRSGGAHRIANHLRLRGWDAEVIDYTLYWKLEELQELVKSRVTSRTKFFGFSFLINRVVNDTIIATFMQWIKDNYPDIVLISGAQATLDAAFINIIDYHLTGYGEHALDSLLNWLFSNGERPKIELNLSRTNHHTKYIDALHLYPAYPYEEAIIKYEKRDFINPKEYGSIEFSRGCKFKCKFCNFPILGVKGDMSRSQESVRDQLMYNYDNYGMTDYLVTDETFNDRTEKISKFADVMETLPFNPYFAGFIRADLLISRPQDREELLRMGFHAQFYGIESFNYESAKFIGKGMPVEKMKAGLIDVKHFFKRHIGKRYRGTISLIAGLPHETNETMADTFKWIRSNWTDQSAIVNPFDLHEGEDTNLSDIDKNYEKLGYRKLTVDDTTYADFSSRSVKNGSYSSIIWENDHMNSFDAIRWGEAVRKVYTFGGIDLMRMDTMEMGNIHTDDKGNVLGTDQKLELLWSPTNIAKHNFPLYLKKYIDFKLSL